MPDTARRKFRLYVDMMDEAKPELVAKVQNYARGSGPTDPSIPSLLLVSPYLPCVPRYGDGIDHGYKILPPWPERGHYINYRVAADQEQSDEAEANG